VRRGDDQVLRPGALVRAVGIAPGDVPAFGVLADRGRHRAEPQGLRGPQRGRHALGQGLHAGAESHDAPRFPAGAGQAEDRRAVGLLQRVDLRKTIPHHQSGGVARVHARDHRVHQPGRRLRAEAARGEAFDGLAFETAARQEEVAQQPQLAAASRGAGT
jgi:hypothetical protein